MRLTSLLAELSAASSSGPGDVEVTAITHDSRQVRPGALFVAVVGWTHDGHAFVAEAVAHGAVAVVVERPVEVPASVTRVVVPNSRRALALLSAAFFGYPAASLAVIGITGTNGKGTTAALVEAMLARAGVRCGIIGTLGATIAGQTMDLGHTTPEAPELQSTLRAMLDAGLTHVVMEVASHALALHRVEGCRFAGAVFTNLTQDHLDFHQTMEAYRLAKRRLFEVLEPDGVAVVNADDPSGRAMAQASRARVLTYGLAAAADVTVDQVRLHHRGAEFVVHTPAATRPVVTSLRGQFNVYNALAATTTALAFGAELDAHILPALAEFSGVPGRFEAVDEGQPFAVIVDYAHTPDSLDNVLRTGRDFATGRLIAVFGCGGDRDRTKRPLMGRIAAHLTDIAIVTSDNPRSEQPEAIIEEIMTGIGPSTIRQSRETGGRVEAPRPGRQAQVAIEPDRRRAIQRAVELAGAGDVVIIAGKGHEPYQEIHGVKHSFDDRAVAREALQRVRASGLNPRAV